MNEVIIRWKDTDAYLLAEHNFGKLKYHWTPKAQDATRYPNESSARKAFKASGAGHERYLELISV